MSEKLLRQLVRGMLLSEIKGADRLEAVARTSTFDNSTVSSMMNAINSSMKTSEVFGSVPVGAAAAEAAVASLLSSFVSDGEFAIIDGKKATSLEGTEGWYKILGAAETKPYKSFGLDLTKLKDVLIYSTVPLGSSDPDPTSRQEDITALVTAISTHKPDVGLVSSGEFFDIEVKSTRQKKFSGSRLPTASRTDYDAYVLVAKEQTMGFSYDAYSGYALSRKRDSMRAGEGVSDDDQNRNLQMKAIKNKMVDADGKQLSRPKQLQTLKDMIDTETALAPGEIEEEIAGFLYSTILNRVMGRQQGQEALTMPITFDGMTARVDLKFESLLRKFIREALLTEAFTKTDEKAIEVMARKQIDKKWKEHEKKIDKMFDERDKTLFRNDAFYKVIARIYQELQRAYAEDQFKYATRYTRKDIPLARFRPS